MNKILGKIIYLIYKIVYGKSESDIKRKIYDIYTDYKRQMKHDISEIIVLCLIIAEDRRFYQHYGVDFYSIIRSFIQNMYKEYKQGASTIEQQFVRVITNQYQVSIKRKIYEIFNATVVDKYLPKNEIPGLYLYVAYYGYSRVGILKVCDKLKIDYRNANLNEAASIIARIKYPESKEYNAKRESKINKRTDRIISDYYRYKKNLINYLQIIF